MVKTSQIKNRTPCIVIPVGSSDVFGRARGDRPGSEEVVGKYCVLLKGLRNKLDKRLVNGILPRGFSDNLSPSRALGVNEGPHKMCNEQGVNFTDVWDSFIYRPDSRRMDGIHLLPQG